MTNIFGYKKFFFMFSFFLSFFLSSIVFADYSDWLKDRKIESISYDLPFSNAVVLKRVAKTNRNDAIRKLANIVSENIYDAASSLPEEGDVKCGKEELASDEHCESNYSRVSKMQELDFDADLIINRSKALRNANNTEKANFKIRDEHLGLELIEVEDSTIIKREGIFTAATSSDGQAIYFYNELNDYNKYRNADAYFSEDDAQEAALEIIDKFDLVPEEDREQLVLYKTDYVHFTGQLNDPGDRIVSTNVYFGRKIGNIPVIGFGSLVRIDFIAGKDIRYIKSDWTAIEADNKIQRVVSRNTFNNRLKGILSTSDQEPYTDINVLDANCGYLDHGSAYSSEKIMQLACQVFYFVKDDTARRVAYIPIGDNIVSQGDMASWGNFDFSSNPDVAVNRVSEFSKNTNDDKNISASYIGKLDNSSKNTRHSYLISAMIAIFLLFAIFAIVKKVGSISIRFPVRIFVIIIAVFAFSIISGFAIAAQPYYNTYMYKNYYDICEDNFGGTQWENWSDWRREMDDIGDCYWCIKNDAHFRDNILSYYGLYGELVAIQTHGNHQGSGVNYTGYFIGYYCNTVFTRELEPSTPNMEIYLNSACRNFTSNNYDTWFGYRNLHRRGNLVSAGCIDSCYIHNSAGVTTWGRIGDDIADDSNTIWHAWQSGFEVGTTTDTIVIYGLGKVSVEDCDNRARGVKWQNRGGWTEYSYYHNEPWPTDPNDKELCGYYVSIS